MKNKNKIVSILSVVSIANMLPFSIAASCKNKEKNIVLHDYQKEINEAIDKVNLVLKNKNKKIGEINENDFEFNNFDENTYILTNLNIIEKGFDYLEITFQLKFKNIEIKKSSKVKSIKLEGLTTDKNLIDIEAEKAKIGIKNLSPNAYETLEADVYDNSLSSFYVDNINKNLYAYEILEAKANEFKGEITIKFKLASKENSNNVSDIHTYVIEGFKLSEYTYDKNNVELLNIRDKAKFKLINPKLKLNKIWSKWINNNNFNNYFVQEYDYDTSKYEAFIDTNTIKIVENHEKEGKIVIECTYLAKIFDSKIKAKWENFKIEIIGFNKLISKERLENYLNSDDVGLEIFQDSEKSLAHENAPYENIKTNPDLFYSLKDKENANIILPYSTLEMDGYSLEIMEFISSNYEDKIKLNLDLDFSNTYGYKIENKTINANVKMAKGRSLQDIMDTCKIKFDLLNKSNVDLLSWLKNKNIQNDNVLFIDALNSDETKELLTKYGMVISKYNIKKIDAKNKSMIVELLFTKDNTFGEPDNAGIAKEFQIEGFADSSNLSDDDFQTLILNKLRINVDENSYYDDVAAKLQDSIKFYWGEQEFNQSFLEDNLITQINDVKNSINFVWNSIDHKIQAILSWKNSSAETKSFSIEKTLKPGKFIDDAEKFIEELQIEVPNDIDVWNIEYQNIIIKNKQADEYVFTTNLNIRLVLQKGQYFKINFTKDPSKIVEYENSINLATKGKIPLLFKFIDITNNIEYEFEKIYQNLTPKFTFNIDKFIEAANNNTLLINNGDKNKRQYKKDIKNMINKFNNTLVKYGNEKYLIAFGNKNLIWLLLNNTIATINDFKEHVILDEKLKYENNTLYLGFTIKENNKHYEIELGKKN